MSTGVTPTHLLVETLGDEPTIVVEDGAPRKFRRLSNSLRGAPKAAVEQAIASACSTKRIASVEIAGASRKDRPRSAVAAPVLGPDKSVLAVDVSLNPDDVGAAGPVAAWEWELGLEDLPPRLTLSGEFFEIYDIGDDFRDRTVYGPADFFARIVRLSDVLAMWMAIRDARIGDKADGEVIIRRESGQLALIRYAQRCIATPAGPRLRGICHEVPNVDAQDLRNAVLDNELSRHILRIQGMYAYVGDTVFPQAPCILKWLTSWVPGIGHGVSTGQTPAVHPDDVPKVVEWIQQARQTQEPVTGVVRTRRAGGGWLSMQFVGEILDPEVSPTIGLLMIYPSSIEAEGVPSLVEPV